MLYMKRRKTFIIILALIRILILEVTKLSIPTDDIRYTSGEMSTDMFLQELRKLVHDIVQRELRQRDSSSIPPTIIFPKYFPLRHVEKLTKDIEDLIRWERAQVFELCAKIVEDEDGWNSAWSQDPNCPQVSRINYDKTLSNIVEAIRKRASGG